jgi:hypothetical protein
VAEEQPEDRVNVTDSHDPDQGVAVPVGPVSGFIYNNTASANYTLNVRLASMNATFERANNAIQAMTYLPPQLPQPQPQQGNEHRQLSSMKRAEALLMDCLTDEQRVDYKVNNWIDVTSNTDNLWRVHTDNIIGNVQLLVMKTDSLKLQYWRDRWWRQGLGQEPMKFCAHLRYVPAADTFLAQILTLRHNEEEFLRVARPF